MKKLCKKVHLLQKENGSLKASVEKYKWLCESLAKDKEELTMRVEELELLLKK